ncbi:hypothetical protein B0T19DRAFT_488907 [Cercophora scortea]|uniref:DUF3176 domain containing protein n=1 Tax=Cercophora scortea TaxID=314031 RepID=A0AAE0I374_9PEZI|nr:hypothetical protein B0T19DRAFT_488907 [Cercophora scortea]
MADIMSFHEQQQPLTYHMRDGPLPPSPPPERSPGDYSRLWRSSPYVERTSMETITYDEPPAKYIGPEMKKALLRRRKPAHKLPRNSRLLRQSMLWWLPEVGWMAMGLICVIIVILTLRSFDGKLAPEWPGRITLNTILALLTSIATVSYMIPVVECLGQLRWLRFSRQSRPLIDFDTIDQATRGPHRTLPLLFTFKGGLLGLLGALLSVSSILSVPVSQQLINYKTESSPGDGLAKAGRLTAFPADSSNSSGPAPVNIMGAKRALFTGVYTVSDATTTGKQEGDVQDDAAVLCSTGNCVWPGFTSLGVCTKVVNITSHLKVSSAADSDWGITKEKASYNARLAAINMTLVAPNLQSLALSIPSAPSLSFRGSDIETVLLDTYLIYGNPSFSPNAEPTFQAAEILHYWCAQRRSVQVLDGEVISNVSEVPSTIVNTAKSLAAQFTSGVISCFEGSTDVNCSSKHWGQLTLNTPDSQATELIVKEFAGVYLSKVIASSFGGIDVPVPRGGNFLQGLSLQIYQAEGDLAWAIGASIFPDPDHPSDPLVQFQDINKLAGNIALSMSNWLRSVGDRSNSSLTGTAMVNQTYIVIHWAWLAFLLCQISLTGVLLAAVVIWTRVEHIQIIKTSSLAGMVALDDGSRAHLGGINDLPGLSTRAALVSMKLEKSSVSGLAMGLTTTRDGAAMAPSFTGGHTATRKRKYQREKDEQIGVLGAFTV